MVRHWTRSGRAAADGEIERMEKVGEKPEGCREMGIESRGSRAGGGVKLSERYRGTERDIYKYI